MKTINQDILTVKTGILCQQVNCQRVMGAGLAQQIRQKWPKVYDWYLITEPRLGKVQFVPVEPDLFVANLYAQDGYGRMPNSGTNYAALEICLDDLRLSTESTYYAGSIYFPYKVGAGLGGGDWGIILKLIESYFPEATICRLP